MNNRIRLLSLIDRIVLILCLSTVLSTLAISQNIFEQIPHIEDEYTYVWQANVAARGEISRPVPDCPRCFMVPFVVDYQGQRFGKYQLPWPVVLSFGVRLGARELVNPLIAGFCIWLCYLLVKKLRDKPTGFIAAILLAVSPFFLINASTLLSHVFSLFLALSFFISWFDLTEDNEKLPFWLPVTTAGLSLGLLVLSRPLTALGIALPFVFHGSYLLLKGTARQRKAILITGAITIFLLPIHFLWQFALTGDPLKNPYTLVWAYDTIGFGEGIGRQTGGYQLSMAVGNVRSSLYVGLFDLFGWLNYSWLLLPVGLMAIIRDKKSLLICSTFVSIIAAYTLYWIGSNLFGPRYYFEALPACVILTAAALRWLIGSPATSSGLKFWKSWKTWRFTFFAFAFTFATVCTLVFYLPTRFPRFFGLYGATKTKYIPFINNIKPEVTPALVIVHIKNGWTDYAVLTELSNPYFNTPFVFSLNKSDDSNALAAKMFPERKVWHYYFSNPEFLIPDLSSHN